MSQYFPPLQELAFSVLTRIEPWVFNRCVVFHSVRVRHEYFKCRAPLLVALVWCCASARETVECRPCCAFLIISLPSPSPTLARAFREPLTRCVQGHSSSVSLCRAPLSSPGLFVGFFFFEINTTFISLLSLMPVAFLSFVGNL